MSKYLILRGCLALMLLVGSAGAVEGMGFLQIDGLGVEKIGLTREGQEDKINLTDLDEPLELAVGRYQVWDIRLEQWHYTRVHGEVIIEIREGETSVFKAGGPLTYSVKVNGRRGRFLEFEYELKGVGGLSYQSPHPSYRPKLEVYKDDKKIGGGTFEYG